MTRHPRAAELFAADTRNHRMTVLHDDGVYRHVRFRDPASSIAWYDLVTWPGCLTVHGDMGTFTFARLTDMFDFFTGSDINPGYWAEKVQGGHPGDIRAHDSDLFREHVIEAFRDYADTHGWPLTEVRTLWNEIQDEILEALDFSLDDERAARDAVAGFRYLPRNPEHREGLGLLPGFYFTDSWEWDTRAFTHRFLWCCFAVLHGVNRYRASRIESTDPEAVAVNLTPVLPPVPRPERSAFPVHRAKTTITLQPKDGLL